MSAWILIFWVGFSNGAAVTAEFNTRAACENAKLAAQEAITVPVRARSFGVCVPKDMP